MKSIAVYCASSKGASDIYINEARKMGQTLAEQGYRLVYGGAGIGSMGAVAKGAIEAGGEVIGVLPNFLARREIAQKGLHELIMVDSMHERKLKMNELCDATITLPGGYGTMEEFFEMITWGQLGLHRKACGVLNVNGFYDHLIAQLRFMNQEKLLKDEYLQMVLIEKDANALLQLIENYNPPTLPQWLEEKTT